MYDLQRTTQFKKDYKLSKKQGHDFERLKFAVKTLQEGGVLPREYKDHELQGKPYVKHRECHIEPNWLLVYRKFDEENLLVLYRLGSHSELFG